MIKEYYLPPLKTVNVSCLCCGGTDLHLSLDTVLCNGFGGWQITRDGELFFEDEMDKEWEEFKTLAFIEEQAKNDPDHDWRAVNYTPLHGETYQRQGDKWVLVEQNEGFA